MKEQPQTDEELKRYYSTGEVAKKLGIKPSLVRFWTGEFAHIKPSKNTRGDRRYTKRNIAQLREIHHLLRERGFTLDGARREVAAAASRPQNEDKQEVIDRLREVRQRLQSLLEDV